MFPFVFSTVIRKKSGTLFLTNYLILEHLVYVKSFELFKRTISKLWFNSSYDRSLFQKLFCRVTQFNWNNVQSKVRTLFEINRCRIAYLAKVYILIKRKWIAPLIGSLKLNQICKNVRSGIWTFATWINRFIGSLKLWKSITKQKSRLNVTRR